MWSEPFTFRNSKGEEIDVLLMDTQGLFDEETGRRECNILTGLALLTSSVLILDTNTDVQQVELLELLHNFLSFGLVAQYRDESVKPFQNLVFLVQDWEKPQEFPFGNQGGRKFIEWKLQERASHDDFHRRLRWKMKDCFESIDCFLLPYPGRVVRQSSFTGSVVNASSDFKDFAKEMQQCIEQLVNPNNFPFKTLKGNAITASGVFKLFESYVDVFNSDSIPSSDDLYSATAEVCDNTIIAKCVDVFKEVFESCISAVPFLDEQMFGWAQEKAEHDALFAFTKSRKMGDSEVIAAAELELKKRLQTHVSYFKHINQNKKFDIVKDLEARLKLILTEYDTEMKSKVTAAVTSPEEFQGIHSRSVSNARQKFLDLKCSSSLEPHGRHTIEKHIQNNEKWLQDINTNREKVEQSFHTTADNAAKKYENALDPFNFMKMQEMEAAEPLARTEALYALESFPYKLERGLFQQVTTSLVARLDVLHARVAERLKKNVEINRRQIDIAVQKALLQKENSMEEPIRPSEANPHQRSLNEYNEALDPSNANIIVKYVDSFKETLESTMSTMPFFSEQDFNRMQNKYKQEMLAQLKTFMEKIGHQVTDAAKAELDTKLDEIVCSFRAMNQEKFDNAWRRFDAELKEAKKYYSEQIEKATRETESLYSLEEFTGINDQILQETTTKFQQQASFAQEQAEAFQHALRGFYCYFIQEHDKLIQEARHGVSITDEMPRRQISSRIGSVSLRESQEKDVRICDDQIIIFDHTEITVYSLDCTLKCSYKHPEWISGTSFSSIRNGEESGNVAP